MPDAGAMMAFIKASTEKEPTVIGKPNRHIIDAIIEKYDLKNLNLQWLEIDYIQILEQE